LTNRKGVSVIVSAILLILIVAATSVLVYEAFSQNLVPTPNTNTILEDLRIVKIDANNVTGSVTLFVLNRGGVNVSVDYTYIENLAQDMIFLNHTSLTDPNRNVPVDNGSTISFLVNNASILNEPLIFKVVTARGTATSLLYNPQTTSQQSQSYGTGGGSNITQFNITVWKYDDVNLNGIWDINETAVPNFLFILECPNSTQVPGLTDSSGKFVFTNLNKGTYTVDDPSNEIVNGSLWLTDVNNQTVSITSANANISFGNYISNPIFSVSGIVFNDTDQNGIYNASVDNPLSGWIVVIKFQSGPFFAAAMTNSTGGYTISGLNPGNYTVKAILKPGWISTTPNAQNAFVINQSVSGINFGKYYVGLNTTGYYTISGQVFNDSNKDAIYDGGDNPLSNWILTIDNGSGNLYGSTTDVNGNYSFLVSPGTYTITQILPLSWITTTPPYYRVVTVTNSSVYGVNFGDIYAPPQIYSISGTVFNDTNQNGIYDAGDQPLPNWIVYYNLSGLPYYVLTNANGTYAITHLAAATYTLSVFLNSTWTNTTAQTQNVVITSGNINGINFGLRPLVMGNITCFVYSDMNLNGVYDPGIDYPLPNWTVAVNGTTYATTDSNGTAIFTIPVGVYSVQELLPGDPAWHNDSAQVVIVNNTMTPAYVTFANYYNAPKTITGMVFNDTDKSGTITGTETGVSDVTVWISNSSGSFSMVTNSTGYYTFTGILNGTCTVQIVLPNGYTNSTPTVVTLAVSPTATTITQNFGIYLSSAKPIYTISGYKFNDTNSNGVWDSATEVKISGWRIYLYNGTYNGTGFPTANVTTDATGTYTFSNVLNGTYSVVEASQSGWVNTTARVQIVVVNGSSMTANFGNNYLGNGTNLYIYSIGGMVFNDTDKNGQFNGADNPFVGATVVLNDQSGLPLSFAVTNTNGNYNFASIANGSYTVNLVLPVGFTNTTKTVVPITIAGVNASGVNFGIFQLNATVKYSIGGYVFNDSNKNGLFDGTEVGLAGWTVMLFNGTYNGTGTPFASAVTTSTGSYIFGGLVNGSYTVIELLNSGYSNTTARSSLVTISGSSISNVSFGNYPNSTSTYTISGYIFNDIDHNGVFNASDTGYGTSSILIQLLDNTGLPIAITYQITGSTNTGFYNFTSLSPGTYTVYIQVPSGYTNSTLSRVTTTITTVNATINFGIYQTSAKATYYISGWKWNDTNDNSVWDAGETGMGTWSIWLYTGNYLGGVPAGTFPTQVTTTNGTLAGAAGSGFYTFSGLANGIYTVIETWTNGYTNTTAIAKLVTIAGSGFGNINFSNTRVPLQNYTISGRVYNDTDSSGSWTQGDAGYASMSYVYINSPQGFPMTRLTTSASPAGNYTFSGLGNGTYSVYISLPSGYTNTTPTSVSVPVAGLNITSIDFGVHKTTAPPTYSIGGFKFNDTNGDGIYNPATDALLSGWTIMLYNGTYSGTQFPITPIQTTAASTGAYLYSNLVPGTYTLLELPQNGWVNSNATRYAIVTITNTSLQVIFGNSKVGVVPVYTVSGLVFNDSDRNGIKGAGEVYSGTINVYADDSLGLPYASVTSNATGYFTLTGLPNGVYTIYPQIPSGWTNSTPARVTVTISGSNVAGINFGIYKTSANATYSIGGFKFNDTAKTGVYNSVSDPPINGWPIYLYSGVYSGTGFPIFTASTSGTGNYTFSNLNNGTYTVIEGEMNGYSTVMARSQVITILGNSTANVIFGNYKLVPVPPYTITGLVFNDSDKDHIFDGADNGYSGATVWINDASGTPLGSATTNSTGYYSFTNLANGTYTVYLQVPSGWTNSTLTQWSVTIAGSSVQAPNTGIYLTGSVTYYSISGYNINDTNKNGVWDSGEPMLSGWTIQLFSGIYTGSQIPIATTTTDASGHYIFSVLSNGTYTVLEVVQPGWVNTTLAQKVVTISPSVVVNFTNYQTVTYSIGGKVFNDTYSNGVYNASDPPLVGWTVTLEDIYSNIFSTTTDANGNYSFTGLSNGTYTVQAVVQAGWQNTTSSNVIMNVSGSSKNLNFGFNKTIPVYSITGFVFNDTDANGVYNSTVDNMVGGWIVFLINSTGSQQFAATNSTGYFTFSSLTMGNYTVQEASQFGWSNTTVMSQSVTITNSSISGIRFGNVVNNTIVVTYTLGGTVFNDTNRNGIYEPGTDGVLSNWYVTLKDQTGNLFLATTDSFGQYSFGNLTAGTYLVQDIPLNGWVNTTAKTQNVTITTSSVSGINFGNFYNRFSVTGYVYFDVNRNGVYDGGDFPLGGWTLNLTNIGTGSKSYTNTSSSGYYSFTDLTTNNYTLSVFTQDGWTPTTVASVSFNLTANTAQNFGSYRTFFSGEFKTFTAAEWSTDSAGYLTNNFSVVYPSGFVQIGVTGESLSYGNLTRMKPFLNNVNTPAVLPLGTLIDPPVGTNPGGQLGANTLALQLSLDYSSAQMNGFNPQLGSLTLYNYSAGPSLNDMTISQILGIANQVLGGGTLPTGYTLTTLSTLLGTLNSAFTQSSDLSWANSHLF
jgi:hypothetical protein